MRFVTMQQRARIATYAATALFLFSSCKNNIERIDADMPNGDERQAFASAQKIDVKALPVARKTKLDEVLAEMKQRIDAIGSWHDFTKGFDDIVKLTGMATLECNNAACAKSIADLLQSLDKKLESYGHPWAAVAHSILDKMRSAIKEGNKTKLIGAAVFFRFSGMAQVDWADISLKSIDITAFVDLANNKLKTPPKGPQRGMKDTTEFKDLISSLTHQSLDPKLSKALIELLDQGDIGGVYQYELDRFNKFLKALHG